MAPTASDPMTDAQYPADAQYLAEVHDISPVMAAGLDDLMALLPLAARPLAALSIVPDWQDRWPLDRHAPFVARVAALGGTRVLHGLTHSLGPDLMNWLLYGHDNRSEFRSLSADETARRLTLGRAALLAAFGRAPAWFCAPRWQGNPHLAPALAALGFGGLLAHDGLHRFGAAPVAMPALSFDEGARGWKIGAGLVLREGLIRRLLAARRPIRLVLHPDDLTRPATLRQICRVTARLEAEGWRPVSLDAASRWGGAA